MNINIKLKTLKNNTLDTHELHFVESLSKKTSCTNCVPRVFQIWGANLHQWHPWKSWMCTNVDGYQWIPTERNHWCSNKWFVSVRISKFYRSSHIVKLMRTIGQRSGSRASCGNSDIETRCQFTTRWNPRNWQSNVRIRKSKNNSIDVFNKVGGGCL